MWYAQIADLYDALVRFDEDIPFFLDQCAKTNGEVLELMAGTGRVSIPLIEAGVRLTCLDLSTEMLEQLRAKLVNHELSATIVTCDARHFDLPQRFALAILPYTSLSEIVGEKGREELIEQVYRHLEPEGRFICTLHNPTVRIGRLRAASREEHRFPHPSGAGEIVFSVTCDYDPATEIARGIEIFEIYSSDSELAERRQVDIQFCVPSEAWFREAAAMAGFIVESLLGDYDGSRYQEASSPYMIWSLRKAVGDPLKPRSKRG